MQRSADVLEKKRTLLSHRKLLKKCTRQSLTLAGMENGSFVLMTPSSQKVGSHECKEGQIFIEPQGFCIIAGIGVKEGLAKKLLIL